MAYLVLAGPSVMSAPGYTLDTLESMVGGAPLALDYFSDLRNEYTNAPGMVDLMKGWAA